MSANTTPVFPNVPVSQAVAFTISDTTTAKAIYTHVGTNGARIDSISVTNTDTSAYTFQLFLRVSSTSYLIGTATIPASAGNLGTVQPVNLLSGIGQASAGVSPFVTDAYGNVVLELGAGVDLYGAVTSTITTAKTLTTVTFGGEF